jgi:hypothetical protein
VTPVAWRREEVPGAGVSIEWHPAWPLLDGERLRYQRFSADGFVALRWGPGATIEDMLATVGLGSAGSTRTVEADDPALAAGRPARRIRIRVSAPSAVPIDHRPPPPDPGQVYVFVGFRVGIRPVLTGYRAPLSELAAVGPLVEHVLASTRPLATPF